jgi:hypothetical protein
LYYTPVETFNNTITFSNTQTLGINEKNIFNKKLDKESEIIFKNAPRIDFPNHEITSREIEDIKELQKKMPYKKHLDEAVHEMDYTNVIKRFGATDKEIERIKFFLTNIADPIIMRLKVEYDRVRPSYLDTDLDTWIDVPLHPSYPSGHSTQSYCIAYLLSNKYPEKRREHENIALKIAKNREIVGVHYASDTKYGKILAKHIVDNSSFFLE